MNTVRPVTIDANQLVSTLYSALRQHIRSIAPFLDEHFGNHLADQALRHDVHRTTTYRHDGTSQEELPRGDAYFLASQMKSVGLDVGDTAGGSSLAIDLLHKVQNMALDHIRAYETANGILITGQTP